MRRTFDKCGDGFVGLTRCAVVILLLAACDDGAGGPADAGADSAPDRAADSADDEPLDESGPVVRFDPASEDFFGLPFPSDARRRPNGSLGFSDWPRAMGYPLMRHWLEAADDLLTGWGLVSAAYVVFDAPIDPDTLPADAEASVDVAGGFPSVFLMDVDPASPDRGALLPVTCQFRAAAGSFHPANLLGCISPIGVVRRPQRLYALVVTRGVTDAEGRGARPDEATAALLGGEEVAGRFGPIDPSPYAETAALLDGLGLDEGEIAALALFTTADPGERLLRISRWYDALPTPELDDGTAIEHAQTWDDYVVLEGHYSVPIIQEGTPPYSSPPQGRIAFGEDGDPVVQSTQSIRFFLTIPRAPMPAEGWPVMLYFHGSGGVAQELIDRGRQETLDSAPAPGTGPASVIAPYGVAGFATDFPLHGLRHDPPDRTGLLLYNVVGNPRAMVDNFIVAACEITLHARFLAELAIDPAVAPELLDAGDSPDGLIRFDVDRMSAFGQSMGSTIGLPAMTIDRNIDAIVLSGSGGALVEIAVASQDPIPVGDTFHLVMGYRDDEPVDIYDPLLNAAQQVFDFVDPLVHARSLFLEPHAGVPAKHVFQPSGLTDRYFSPRSRAGLATALGIDLSRPVLEPLALEQMAWSGHGEAVSLPVSGNAAGGVTGIGAQYEPEVSDGHYVAFQRDDTKAQYGCFIWSVGEATAPVFFAPEDAAIESCAESVRR